MDEEKLQKYFTQLLCLQDWKVFGVGGWWLFVRIGQEEFMG